MRRSAFLPGTLQRFHVNRCLTFFTLFDIEGHALSLVQGLKAAAFDCAEMNEYIGAFIGFDESKTLFFIKPFYFAVRHLAFLLA